MSEPHLHLVQLIESGKRRVAIVEGPELILLGGFESVFALAQHAIEKQRPLSGLAREHVSTTRLSYDDVYSRRSTWKLLPAADIPGALQKVLVSGTGLTHLGSARDRQAMHLSAGKAEDVPMTDSMRMFELGRQQGRPSGSQIGAAPEWFYKGDGSVLQAASAPLVVPGHAEDGGEEAEIAAVYLIGPESTPYRIGMTIGNEFSDHVFERRNYLNLAGSKLRSCSIGPELVVGADFDDIPGKVRILRNGETLWEKSIRTGERNMCHSLANLEHHHFKFEGHRQPGMLHVHFMGADTLSFGEGIRLQPGDVTEVEFEGFGRPLRNTIESRPQLTERIQAHPMR
ncbi:MAG TPA: AraD1 family protein [Terracidiphilus sp.]|jgi:hypothetical protein